MNGTKDTIYLINNDVWKLSITAVNFPNEPFIPQLNRLFYALGVDPINADVYVSDAIDYMQAGVVFRFANSGQAIDTFKVGIVPGYFCFKK